MHCLLFRVFALLGLLALTIATPITSVSLISPRKSSASSQARDCFDSDYINQSTDGSPRVADCLQITYDIIGDTTYYFWSGGAQTQLAQFWYLRL